VIKQSRSRLKGFTLIEVLVVLFIIAIVTSMALLSIGSNENRRLQVYANELTQILTLAEEQAMLQPMVLGLWMNEQTLQFASYTAMTQEKKAIWSPLQDKLLGKHVIPRGIQVDIEVGEKRSSSQGEAENNDPQIIISTNGDVTPFNIYIGKSGQEPRYVIEGHADGSVTNQSLS
jgi:general secretion pathway protein H